MFYDSTVLTAELFRLFLSMFIISIFIISTYLGLLGSFHDPRTLYRLKWYHHSKTLTCGTPSLRGMLLVYIYGKYRNKQPLGHEVTHASWNDAPLTCLSIYDESRIMKWCWRGDPRLTEWAKGRFACLICFSRANIISWCYVHACNTRCPLINELRSIVDG